MQVLKIMEHDAVAAVLLRNDLGVQAAWNLGHFPPVLAVNQPALGPLHSRRLCPRRSA